MAPKNGSLTVQLIQAKTRKPFQEHTAPDGKVYAEVEPGEDYYIRLKHEVGAKKAYPTPQYIDCSLEIDGKEFRSSKNIAFGLEKIIGIVSKAANTKTKTAFRFHLQESKEASQSGKPWFGCIKVKVYETSTKSGPISWLDDGGQGGDGSQDAWDGGTVDGFIAKDMKKVVRSRKGQHAIVKNKKPRSVRGEMVFGYHISRGKHIQTIELYYCTAVGLIWAGVLPKPPGFVLDQMRKDNPFLAKTVMTPGLRRCLQVKPVSVPTTAAGANALLGLEETRVDLFDLTDADSDQEGDIPRSVAIISPDRGPSSSGSTGVSRSPKKRARRL
jgi:hypothetical protein